MRQAEMQRFIGQMWLTQLIADQHQMLRRVFQVMPQNQPQGRTCASALDIHAMPLLGMENDLT
ncbi:hypothetical protein D3C85_1657030 [compost metagenome]